MSSHIKNQRSKELPLPLRKALVQARHQHGWSQAELGERSGMPQMHISGIETGKVVPRYDTLLELVRILDHDLILVPRELVPVVQSLVRDHGAATRTEDDEEQPLYALDTNDEECAS